MVPLSPAFASAAGGTSSIKPGTMSMSRARAVVVCVLQRPHHLVQLEAHHHQLADFLLVHFCPPSCPAGAKCEPRGRWGGSEGRSAAPAPASPDYCPLTSARPPACPPPTPQRPLHHQFRRSPWPPAPQPLPHPPRAWMPAAPGRAPPLLCAGMREAVGLRDPSALRIGPLCRHVNKVGRSQGSLRASGRQQGEVPSAGGACRFSVCVKK